MRLLRAICGQRRRETRRITGGENARTNIREPAEQFPALATLAQERSIGEDNISERQGGTRRPVPTQKQRAG